VVLGLAVATAIGNPAPAARVASGAVPLSTAGAPSKADRVAAITATASFRSAVAGDAAQLADNVSRVVTAVAGGDLVDARAAELAAQSDFDEVRFVDAASPQNAASLDALAGQVPPGASFGGLHALERDLWVEGSPATDLSSLMAQAAVARELVAKQSLAPATIVATGVAQLDWVIDAAIAGREELYSHHDAVDIAGGVAGAEQAFAAVEPLACSVEVAGCRTVASDLTALAASVAALGPAADVPDAAVSVLVQRALSVEADRTADALAALEVPLLPFGTAGPQPYGAAGPLVPATTSGLR
jgi:iron uptake system component EfeO